MGMFRIAVITTNTLEGMALADLISRIKPMAEVVRPGSADEAEADTEGFFHFFVTTDVLMSHAAFFLRHRQKVIVLIHGAEQLPLQDFHTLNVCQPESDLIRSILHMAHAGHHQPGHHVPEAVREMGHAPAAETPLTPREQEVLSLVAQGLLNKEIAERLHVGLTTVISHRKNLTAKLGIKSVSGLTIYAVTHGIAEI